MGTSDLALIGAVLLLYAAFSRRLASTVITAPIVFVAVGLVLGPELLDVIDLNVGSEDLGLLAELTLALMLFSDASALDTRRLQRENSMPLRLLGLALPLTIVVGSITAVLLFPGLVVFEAVALAVLLAPTDAALGQVVVADQRIPSIVRQGLNAESGLNDGICVPLLLAAVAFAEIEEAPSFGGEILVDLVRELGVATIIGAIVAVAVAMISRWSAEREWMAENWSMLVPLITTLVAYSATTDAGGSGFIASFVAGVVYGRLLGAAAHRSTELTEDLGQLLSAVTFLLFGVVLVGESLARIDLQTVVYAVLSLTVIRMLPVAIALLGTGARRPTVEFAGWFGPRGLATIVFALTVIEGSTLTGAARIIDVATITVVFSVVAHGVTASPLTDRYIAWLAAHRGELSYESNQVDVGAHSRPPRVHWWKATTSQTSGS